MVKFDSIKDLKRQPVGKKALKFPSGFPIPMGKQMSQGKKLKFPSPKRAKSNATKA